MRPGDFTNLAEDYAKFRPSYNKHVVNVILNEVCKNSSDMKIADVGAGTGIFTRCLLDAGVKDVIAVEPNIDMREAGKQFLGNNISFLAGSAEETGLKSQSYDLVTMASSFHWPDTNKALQEFDRILAPNGVFCALWNPRLTEKSITETEVQSLLCEKYNIENRVSSGLSGISLELRDILYQSGNFSRVMYVDAVDIVKRSHEEYLGAWRSVNDIQSQLGADQFSQFMNDIETIISKRDYVEVHYLTRAWIACK